MKCEENAEELPSSNNESFLQLSCFISQDVKYLQTGLKLRLEERLTKNSPSLSRDASYLKTSRISRLPAYLCIQLVRFFYKEKEKVRFFSLLADILLVSKADKLFFEMSKRLAPKYLKMSSFRSRSTCTIYVQVICRKG
jgi:ubiquitin carboxyl-terminal hydrolase 14